MAAGVVPTPTPESVPFWQAAAEGRLVIQWCRPCAAHYFYPRVNCPRCGSTDVEWREVSGRGRLLSYVINHRPMPPIDPPGPQVIALVELAEGVRMLTNIVDSPAEPDALPLDAQVVVGFTPRGDWQLPVFRLVTATPDGKAESAHNGDAEPARADEAEPSRGQPTQPARDQATQPSRDRAAEPAQDLAAGA